MKKRFRSVLLMKVPHCVHPDAVSENESFRWKHTFRPIPSFALASLCAFFEKHNTFGYDIKAVDINIEAYKGPDIPIDINEYFAVMEGCIRDSHYDVLAISVMFVFNWRWLQLAVSLSRKYHPEARIIVGGGYPTVFPEKCLKDHDVDSLAIGEGESTLVHILNRYNDFHDRAFETKFPFDGYGEKNKDGTIRIIPLTSFLNMEDIPVPAWDYLDVDKYFRMSGDRILPIEGVRGCPYRCTYCNTQLTWGYRLRYKNVGSLIEEMKSLDRRYHALLHFIDDNRSIDREWMIDFLSKTLETNIHLDPAPSSFHVDHIDEEILDLLKKAGVKTIGIAVETGSRAIQKRIRKNLNLDRVRDVVRLIKSKGMSVHVNFMFGFPKETMDQIEETLDLARELRAHSYQLVKLVPYPGTDVYEETRNADLLVYDDDYLDNFEPRRFRYLKSDDWSYAQLEEIVYDANIELNFLNNPSLDEKEKLDSFLNFLERLSFRIPGHVIAKIVAGYLYKLTNRMDRYEQRYLEAAESFKVKEVYDTFGKYLSWDNPIIHDFNQFCISNHREI